MCVISILSVNDMGGHDHCAAFGCQNARDRPEKQVSIILLLYSYSQFSCHNIYQALINDLSLPFLEDYM